MYAATVMIPAPSTTYGIIKGGVVAAVCEVAACYTAVPGLVAFAAAYLAPHQDRPACASRSGAASRPLISGCGAGSKRPPHIM